MLTTTTSWPPNTREPPWMSFKLPRSIQSRAKAPESRTRPHCQTLASQIATRSSHSTWRRSHAITLKIRKPKFKEHCMGVSPAGKLATRWAPTMDSMTIQAMDHYHSHWSTAWASSPTYPQMWRIWASHSSRESPSPTTRASSQKCTDKTIWTSREDLPHARPTTLFSRTAWLKCSN